MLEFCLTFGAKCFLVRGPLRVMADKMYWSGFDLGASGTDFLIIALDECVSLNALKYAFESQLLLQFSLFSM